MKIYENASFASAGTCYFNFFATGLRLAPFDPATFLSPLKRGLLPEAVTEPLLYSLSQGPGLAVSPGPSPLDALSLSCVRQEA